ncbi:MAG: GldG family protein [Deltaproteobacteria bacterium]|nr:GldG family protein [Deltaproteobacteria bacterium]
MSKLSKSTNAILYASLVIGSVILFNMIVAKKFMRLDLTADGVYTISAASKKLVRGLPDRLTIKAFITPDLPPRVKNLARYMADMVLDYAAHSQGRIDAEVIHVATDDQAAKDEATRFKIKPIKIGQYGTSKTSVQLAYLGLAFQYGGKIEVLPPTVSVNDLEYQISSTIRRMVREKKLKVGVTSGHGEPTPQRGLANAKRYLKDYEVVNVDLTEGKKPIPDDIAVLLVVGPKKRFAERALYEMDKFLMSGRGIAFFLDGMILETPRGNFKGQQPPKIARTNVTGLEPMLAHYGVKLTADIVMDRQNRPLPLVAANGRAVLVNHPAFPVVTDLSKEVPITKFLKRLLMVFPSSLELVGDGKDSKSGVQATVLARSTAASWSHTGFFLFNPMHRPKETKTVGPFELGYLLKGTFASFYSGRATPEAGAPQPPQAKAPQPTRTKRAPTSARIVVVSDADFVQDAYLRLNPDNLLMLLNSVDFLAQDESLIAIRSKKQTRRPLEHKEDADITFAKWANILGVPLLFLALGFVRWRMRASARLRSAEDLIAQHMLSRPAPVPKKARSEKTKAPPKDDDRAKDGEERQS